jgi:hypothetical protein
MTLHGTETCVGTLTALAPRSSVELAARLPSDDQKTTSSNIPISRLFPLIESLGWENAEVRPAVGKLLSAHAGTRRVMLDDGIVPPHQDRL